MNDEQYFEIVAKELSESGPIVGLWGMCYAECEGDERRSRALYLRRRVAQLQEEEKQAQQRARRHEEAKAAIHAEAMRSVKREAHRKSNESLKLVAILVGGGFITILLISILALAIAKLSW